MESNAVFVDMLEERRKDCDISWVTRPMNPLLPHKLPTESKYSRDKIIRSVLSDAQVKYMINAIAAAGNISTTDVENNACAMVNEIASKEDLMTVRWLGIFITKAMKRMFSKIYINESKLFKLKEEMQVSQAQYVYVPSHRSYLDFILMSYVLFSYDMALPNIASGKDFYNMKIIGELLRKTGAFYMRRSFSDDLLYKEIFRSYIGNIINHSGRAIEFFIEGTRSRSQKSIMPKYGLLSMILESLLQGNVPDIYFVPISISYERPPEELLFVYEMLGYPKPKESTMGFFQSLSVLQKLYSYGCIYFNIGEPISAHQFVDTSQRRARVLSPYTKLPSSVIEHVAYLIIESQKKNTVLLPINIIALLFNERIQTKPKELYTLDSLIKDYLWFKDFITKTLGMLVHSKTEINNKDNVKQEILESLRPHAELVELNSSNTFRLKQRHKGIKLGKYLNVKGHCLSEPIMEVAVSAINIAIYINPTLTVLARLALINATIGEDGIQKGEALKRYELLRKLFSVEFVMRPITDENLIREEWEESLNMLLSQKCLYTLDNLIFPGNNQKLFSILHNIALPFIDVAYVICTLLSEWNEETLGELTFRTILIETQKKVERLMLEGKHHCQHPYCLSLDLYSATLSSLLSQNIIAYQKRDTYRADKVALTNLIGALRDLPLRRSAETYFDVFPSIVSLSLMDIRANL